MLSKKIRFMTLLAALTLSMYFVGYNFAIASPEAVLGDTATRGDVLLNEMVIDPFTAEFIELYNTLSAPINITNWEIWGTNGNFNNPIVYVGNVSTLTIIPAMGYVVLNDSTTGGNMDNLDIDNFGETIVLKDSAGTVIDVMAFADHGGAPGHPDFYSGSDRPGISSIARVATGGTNATDWNIDLTPTPGSVNDAPGVDLGGSDIVINEVNTDDNFIELYNTHSFAQVDLTGWSVGTTNDDLFPLSGIIDSKGYAVFRPTEQPPEPFDNGLYFFDGGEAVYLYNASGFRVDQMGYSNFAGLGFSWSRFPDGNSTAPFTNDGYNNATSNFVILPASPGLPNSDAAFAVLEDFIVSNAIVALDSTVAVAVQAAWSNGTALEYANASVSIELPDGSSTSLTYDAASGYYNGSVDLSTNDPVKDEWGFYHTTALKANVTAGSSTSLQSTGVLINPGYVATDTVLLFDEGHQQFYTFSDYYKSGGWASMLLETGVADYMIALDNYAVPYRLEASILSDVDLLVLNSPESDFSEAWLTQNEVDAILGYVKTGGGLWLSGEQGAFNNPEVNGLKALTSESWGIDWIDGQYQDGSISVDSGNIHLAQPITRTDGTVFDSFDAFGATNYYYNGMVVNKTKSVAGTTVTEAISATVTSSWDGPDQDYDADLSIVGGAKYAVGYAVENGTGRAYVQGSSSVFGHYDDFQTGQDSAQFAFNVFAWLLNTNPVQYPKLQLFDQSASLAVVNDKSVVEFKVKLNSTLAGATLFMTDVGGDLDGDLFDFTDADNDGVWVGTWDATAATAGTYMLSILAEAENGAGGLFIEATLDLTVTVTAPASTSDTSTTDTSDTGTTDTSTSKDSPGFEMISVLMVFALIGIATVLIRKRR